jgi:hypothetical protein
MNVGKGMLSAHVSIPSLDELWSGPNETYAARHADRHFWFAVPFTFFTDLIRWSPLWAITGRTLQE